MLSLLISLSTVNDPEVRQYAAYAVVKIAQNSDLRKIVTEEGGLEPGKEILNNQKCVSRTVELLQCTYFCFMQ